MRRREIRLSGPGKDGKGKMHLLVLLLIALLTPAKADEAAVVKITPRPQPLYIEKGAAAQYLNFDFVIENLTGEKLVVSSVEVSVFDRKDRLVLRRFIDGNGTRPSIETLNRREIEGRQTALIFNPFHTFDNQVELKKLRYEFSFRDPAQKKDYKSEIVVLPAAYETRTNLILPVKGRMIVYDGHDFYAHHRRFDYTIPGLQQLGFNSNFMRYSYDFVPVNEHGATYQGKEASNQNYFGFGSNLLAAGDGKIVAIVDDKPDSRSFNEAELANNPMVLWGNYVVIDHLNGEYSLYGHFKQGSGKVKVGESVRQGQVIAQMGASGSSMFPHLHYELQTGVDTKAEGLPSYFRNFRRILGSRVIEVKLGQVDTGDIVEAR
jgi:murein DD-endopeptidase MepM/ murein hydrolase activator NlpD